MDNKTKIKLSNELVSNIEKSHELVCARINADPNLSKLKKKYLCNASLKLCEIEYCVQVNRKLDLRGMIEEDILSRKLRQLPISLCRCSKSNRYCFCVDLKNRWLR